MIQSLSSCLLVEYASLRIVSTSQERIHGRRIVPRKSAAIAMTSSFTVCNGERIIIPLFREGSPQTNYGGDPQSAGVLLLGCRDNAASSKRCIEPLGRQDGGLHLVAHPHLSVCPLAPR